MRTIRKILKVFVVVDLVVAVAALITKFTVRSEGGPADETFRLVSVFDGSELRSTAVLRHGSVLAMFGGAQLDLRRASVIDDGATIEVTALFGGVEVVVPDTWAVTAGGGAVLGGFVVRVPDPETMHETAPRLRVDVRAALGGVSVVARPVLKAAEG